MSRAAFPLLLFAVVSVMASPAAAQQPDAIDALLGSSRGAGVAVETAAPSGDAAICRIMTDLAQRGRRERVCMNRAGWAALVRAARPPSPAGASFRVSARAARHAR